MTIRHQTPPSTARHLDEDALQRLRALLVEDREAHAIRLERLSPDGPLAAELGKTQFDSEVASTTEALDEIDGALERIEAGTYGLCGRCSAEIPFERLEAVPRARHCVTCQSRSTSSLFG